MKTVVDSSALLEYEINCNFVDITNKWTEKKNILLHFVHNCFFNVHCLEKWGVNPNSFNYNTNLLCFMLSSLYQKLHH